LLRGAGKGYFSLKHIGVLSLQGGFQRHLEMVNKIGQLAVEIRYPEQLDQIDGLIIPGGESTTIGKLLDRNHFISPLKEAISGGLPIFGTCAGLILLANTIEKSEQIKLGGLEIEIQRNAYGSQIDSFESSLVFRPSQSISFLPPLSKETLLLEGIFIRAPKINWTSQNVEVLSSFHDSPVCVQQKNILGATFHPELTNTTLLHEYFLAIIHSRV